MNTPAQVTEAHLDQAIADMTNAFLCWPLPESVCADGCATRQGKGRSGTNLMSIGETLMMMQEVVRPVVTQLIADGEARAVTDALEKERAHFTEYLDQREPALPAMRAERDQLRAEAERSKEQQTDDAKSANETIEFLKSRAARAEAEVKNATEARDFHQVRAVKAEAELAAIKQGYGELGRYEKLRLRNADLSAELAKERARLSKALRALSVISQDFSKHGKSVANYSDGEYTQDYTTRKELIDAAIKEDRA